MGPLFSGLMISCLNYLGITSKTESSEEEISKLPLKRYPALFFVEIIVLRMSAGNNLSRDLVFVCMCVCLFRLRNLFCVYSYILTI